MPTPDNVSDIPKRDAQGHQIQTAMQQWLTCVDNLQSVATTNTAIQTLTAGSWMLTEEGALPFLVSALSLAAQHQFSYSVTLVSDATHWSHTPDT